MVTGLGTKRALQRDPFPEAAAEGSIPDRFSAMARVHGARTAIHDGTRTISYAALDAWSNGIAREVARHDNGDARPILLMLEQGAANIAAILGVLKAGSAYAPVESSCGPDTLMKVASYVGAAAIVTDEHGLRDMESLSLPVIRCTGLLADRPPDVTVGPSTVAYVFFTSGSTGEPKAVYDAHCNVLHNVLRYTTTLRISHEDRLSLVQSPTFSGTVSTTFAALLSGATLYPRPVASTGVARLAETIVGERLTMLHFVPSVFRALVRAGSSFPSVRVVRLEGDAASSDDVERFRQAFSPDAVLVNGLGATETGLTRQFFVDASTVVPPGPLPVGYAVPGVEVSVADDGGHPVGPGVTGEIVVRGEHLALGYWRRPDLTAAAFTTGPEGRTYRTGDLGRLEDDGCLVHLGRADRMRKIRGAWVDSGRVVAALLRLDSVESAAVATRETATGGARLVAWVVPAHERSADLSEIRARLTGELPASHVPATIVVVDDLPVTPHGKIDVAALIDPPRHAPASRRPLSDLELRLQRVWEDVLETHPIGVDESFFDLGGDSLAAMELVAAAEREAGRRLHAAALFEAPTIERLAALIGQRVDGGSLVEPLAEGGGRPLFLAHDWGGEVGLYRELARCARMGPVLGVRQASVPSPSTSFEGRAATLVDAVRSQQAAGPYRLGGHCFGAVLAFEAARQLVDAGEDVELLALLGISPWDFRLVSPDAWRRYIAALGYPGLSARARRAFQHARSSGLLQTARRTASAAPSLIRHYRVRRGERPVRSETDALREGNVEAFSRYRPEPFPGTVLVILAAETTSAYTDDPHKAWAGLARRVVTYVLPGRDIDMLRPPTVSETAALLRAAV